MANDINILYDHTCGGCFLVRHLNWWVLYDLHIYGSNMGPKWTLKIRGMKNWSWFVWLSFTHSL
jgi:hypothetical protein